MLGKGGSAKGRSALEGRDTIAVVYKAEGSGYAATLGWKDRRWGEGKSIFSKDIHLEVFLCLVNILGRGCSSLVQLSHLGAAFNPSQHSLTRGVVRHFIRVPECWGVLQGKSRACSSLQKCNLCQRQRFGCCSISAKHTQMPKRPGDPPTPSQVQVQTNPGDLPTVHNAPCGAPDGWLVSRIHIPRRGQAQERSRAAVPLRCSEP